MDLFFGASVTLKANHGYLQLHTLATAILKPLDIKPSLSIWVATAEGLLVLTLLLLHTQKSASASAVLSFVTLNSIINPI